MIVRPKSKGRPKVPKRQIKGTPYVQKRSEFLGSVLTPENVREFRDKQFEFFVEQFTKDVIEGREKIKAQEGKTPEEIEAEVDFYNEKQPSEEELMGMADRFARKMVTKENKHHQAYLAGKPFFNYNGQRYQVITQLLVDQTQSIHEIIEQAKQYERSKNAGGGEPGQGQDPLEGIINFPEGDNEAIRSESGDSEDSESEYSGECEGPVDELLPNESND